MPNGNVVYFFVILFYFILLLNKKWQFLKGKITQNLLKGETYYETCYDSNILFMLSKKIAATTMQAYNLHLLLLHRFRF